MALRCYLAMTARELGQCHMLPKDLAWMACHFAPYGAGIEGLPGKLPRGSLLILNDRIPVTCHDPVLVAGQLAQVAETHKAAGVLLDFQNKPSKQSISIAREIARQLSCPIAITESYAKEIDCGVFLSPLPLRTSLKDHISPWKGRPIWLEVALDAQKVTVTRENATVTSCKPTPLPAPFFTEEKLHCDYHMEVSNTAAVFTICRTKQNINVLLQEAEALGITCAVGLYQELKAEK